MSFLTILKGITEVAQIGATIATGVMQNKETERVNRKNEEIAERNFREEKKQQKFQNMLSSQNLALNRQSLALTEKESALNRAERTEERGYDRMQNAANKYAEYLNSKIGIQSTTLSPIFARGAR